MNFFSRCFSLYKRESLYVWICLFILTAIACSLMLQNRHSGPTQEEISLQNTIRDLDRVMKLHSEDPAFLESRFAEDPFLKWISQGFMAVVAVVLLTGVWVDLRLFRKAVRKEPWLSGSEEREAIGWGLGEVVKVVLLFLFFGIVLNFVFLFFDQWIPEHVRLNFLMLSHTTLTDMCMAGLIFYFVQKVKGNPLRLFGFDRTRNWLKEVWCGIKAYVAVLPLFMLVVTVVGWLSWLPNGCNTNRRLIRWWGF
jgi:hypothetical protein